jgi:gamma-glutamyltranspeptidase/glutathione hydrolase
MTGQKSAWAGAGEGMVCAAQPEAVEAGVDILRAGGNAVDAAIATAFVQGVIDPLMCGIAGFGSMAVYQPGGAQGGGAQGGGVHEYLDFHAPSPSAVTPTMWESILVGEARDGFGFILEGRVNDLGYGAAAVPASLGAYAEAHRSWGRLPWGDLLETAIRYASDGWVVSPGVVAFWNGEVDDMGRAPHPERLAYSATGRAIYCRPDGTPKQIGDRVQNPGLAATLTRIADVGADDFYRGEIAARIAADMAAHGGLVSAHDLEQYRPIRSAPLEFDYRGLRVTTNRPPGGGVILGEILKMAEQFDLAALGHNSPDYIEVLAEVMKRATIDKDTRVGDPRFVDVPVEELLSDAYAAAAAVDIRAGKRAVVSRLGDPIPPDTTHLSVVDADGNCVSMTHSLGIPSGAITDGLGFMYNGCMAVFDPRPGRPGSIAPGKSRFSAISPTIVFRDDRPEIVIGAPGGTQITMGIAQALINTIDFGMGMQEAVQAPRFSSTSNSIDVCNRIPRSVERELQARGYPTVRSILSYDFAVPHGIRITGAGLEGGADPGRDGMAMSTGR